MVKEIKLDPDIQTRLEPHLKAEGDQDRIVNEALRDWLDRQEGAAGEEEEESWDKRVERKAKAFAGMK